MPPADQFLLPMRFELTAVFLFAVTGALLAIEKRYDFVGVFVLALLSATGGGMVRDGLFLQAGAPQALQDPRYLYVVGLATIVCLIVGGLLNRLRVVFLIADALGLGIYAVVGCQRGMEAGLHFLPASFVGLANAIGSGVLRDVLTGQEALIFKPGEFYVLAAAIGTLVFVALIVSGTLPAREAAFWSIGTTFAIRMASIRFNWQTRAVTPLMDRPRKS